MPEPAVATVAPPDPAAAARSQRQIAQAASKTINVSALPSGDPTVKPPKPGSAMSRLLGDLGKAPGTDTAATTTSKATAAKPETTQTAQSTETARETETQETAETTSEQTTSSEATTTAAAEPAKGKRVSPWKLVDEHKAARAKAEQEALQAKTRIAELEKQVVPQEKIKAYEKQIEDLSAELRYYNAEKYDPEVKKATEDYQSAWNRAMQDVSELTVKGPDGQPRQATAQDLLDLVNAPLGQARALALEAFGDFANDVMAYRNEIKKIFDARQAKLNELKTTGSDREKQRFEAHQKQMAEVSDFVRSNYQKANEEAVSDPKHGEFFRPKEGDNEWNGRLEKGFKLVDEAYSLNPMDPRLTADQRVQIIRKHAAVRNRAAAYGPLRFAYQKALQQLAALEGELKKYKESTPATAGRTPAPPQSKPRGMAGLMHSLEGIAKPG